MGKKNFEPRFAAVGEDARTDFRSTGHSLSPRPFQRIGHVLAVRRGEAHSDTEIGQIGVRIMPAVELGNWLGVALAGFRLHQYAFLEVGLEKTLQGDEKRRAVMTMPVRIASRHNFRVVDLYLHLGITGKRALKRIEQQVARETMAGWHHAL